MKVYLSGPRDHWISPYTLLERAFFWTDWSRCARWTLQQTQEDQARIARGEKSQFVEHPAWVEKVADWLAPVSQAVRWTLDRVHPEIRVVRIDPSDTWGMDHTLAHIVLPMLRQLKATKHGSPLVDDEDVPEHLRSTAAPPKKNDWDVDDNHHQRWDWAMDEMIHAFESLVDDSWQEQYHSGEHDLVWTPVDAKGNEVARGEHQYYRMDRGPNDTYSVDRVGLAQAEARIQNGFRSFGKYFQSLWD